MNYLLYNDLADGGRGKENSVAIHEELTAKLGEMKVLSVLGLDYKAFLEGLHTEDKVVLIGGDGTLNNTVNRLDANAGLPCDFYLYPSGTGNDFFNDVKELQDADTKLVRLNDLITGLPVIEVKDRSYYFLNGIGYGIDGECCVEAERLKKEGKQDINYGSITVGLLMKTYKAPTATVKWDGGEIVLKKAYLASAMNGRYYGGGMMIAPEQKRGSHELSLVVIHGRGKIGTLLLFPKIFKGTHVKAKKAVFVKKGTAFEVSFDRPCALQIDGEVVEGVTSYKVRIA